MKIDRNTLKQLIIQEMKDVRDTYNDEVVQKNKQSRKKGIKDLIGEDGHSDVPSARRKLMTAVEDAGDILNNLDPEADTELPSWWMSKVTLAADYLNKARDYFLIGEQEDFEFGKTKATAQKFKDDVEIVTRGATAANISEPERAIVSQFQKQLMKAAKATDLSQGSIVKYLKLVLQDLEKKIKVNENEKVLNANVPIENKIPALHDEIKKMLKDNGVRDVDIPDVIAAIANLNRETN